MGLKQVSFVERSSLSQRVPYQRFHCIVFSRAPSNRCGYPNKSTRRTGRELWTRNAHRNNCTQQEITHTLWTYICTIYSCSIGCMLTPWYAIQLSCVRLGNIIIMGHVRPCNKVVLSMSTNLRVTMGTSSVCSHRMHLASPECSCMK